MVPYGLRTSRANFQIMMDTVLARFREANLMMKSSKRSFDYESVTALGYEVRKEGVKSSRTVASREALGASLMQGEKKLREMHLIVKALGKLSDLEKKYSATERECLGVLWALKYIIFGE
ncbi:hypothetical protein EVAR_61441_1 [Eumeta japonica]|uniref:Reverse transcriptase RNase H-like domain-containing protein n=1 Tax=Eumeta variegata TaxID=151549 RepID=A0A4C1Y3Q9_EUMVA|nr:hypothetical protein EVAR_61441_1 [Eumeta japonica]